MSLIKDLKNNQDNIFNIVEAIELFVPDKKSKYTNMLLRLMRISPNFEEHADEIIEHFVNGFPKIDDEGLRKMKPMQLLLLFVFVDRFFNPNDMENFVRFCELNELGYIEETDLSKYKTLDELINQVNIAEIKVQTKEMEKEIVKVYEDSEWLILRPLTYGASRKYGSNTKWCTTSENNPEYFLKYSCRGVLIYCMNKKNGYKVASFNSLDLSEPEFSFWNQVDKRIDSIESELTPELIKVIKNVCFDSQVKTNRELMSNEIATKEHKVLRKYMSDSSINEIITRANSMRRNNRLTEQYESVRENRLSNRIMRALGREDETILSMEHEVMEEPTPIQERTYFSEMDHTVNDERDLGDSPSQAPF